MGLLVCSLFMEKKVFHNPLCSLLTIRVTRGSIKDGNEISRINWDIVCLLKHNPNTYGPTLIGELLSKLYYSN